MITNMSSIVVVNKAATPVSTTLTPASRVADNTARWQCRTLYGGLPLGFSTYTLNVKEPTAAGGVYRVKATYQKPKLDLSVPAVPKLLGTGRFNGEFIFPDCYTDQDRMDFVQEVMTSLAQGSATAVGDNVVVQGLPY